VRNRALLVGLAALCACDRAREPKGEAVYACSDAVEIRVTYFADSARLVMPNDTLMLQQVVAGSGIRYSDGNVTVHSKGPDAFVMVGDSVVHPSCSSIRG
jgi:membrane-bound inhibitor of C-type lysozyme